MAPLVTGGSKTQISKGCGKDEESNVADVRKPGRLNRVGSGPHKTPLELVRESPIRVVPNEWCRVGTVGAGGTQHEHDRMCKAGCYGAYL